MIALETFWQAVTELGTPLIEPIEGDDDHALVTFLWRPEAEVQNVVVYCPLGPLVTDNVMARLPHTDLWHRTYRVRTDVRTPYWFCPNDSLFPWNEDQDRNERSATWVRDPLNPRTTAEVPLASALIMPAAPPQLWSVVRPGVPTGTVFNRKLRSKILGNSRQIWTYIPPGYDPHGEPYALLLLFDGWAYMHLIPTPTILDNLLAERRIPPLVAVMVDNAPGARDRELGCYEPFVDFLTQELRPWVRRRYHVTGDPAWSTIGGSSRGGLAAAFTGLRRPDLFGNVLCQSGAFWWAPPGDREPAWLARQFADHARLSLRFYVDVGRLEVWPSPDDGPSTRVNQHMRDVLHAKDYPVHYAEFGGGHDYACWEGTLPDGLLFLLGERRPARTSAT